MIWLKPLTKFQFSKFLAFLMEKQIQKFNLLITKIVFLWVDMSFSDRKKIWPCVMNTLLFNKHLLNALGPSCEMNHPITC